MKRSEKSAEISAIMSAIKLLFIVACCLAGTASAAGRMMIANELPPLPPACLECAHADIVFAIDGSQPIVSNCVCTGAKTERRLLTYCQRCRIGAHSSGRPQQLHRLLQQQLLRAGDQLCGEDAHNRLQKRHVERLAR